MWIKFANLCRKSDRKMLAEKTLNSLLGHVGEEEKVSFIVRSPRDLTNEFFRAFAPHPRSFMLTSSICGHAVNMKRACPGFEHFWDALRMIWD